MTDSWVTADDASTITGKTVVDADLAVAMPIIDIYSGITVDAQATLRSKDLRMLRYATAYQAAWMKANTGAVTGMDVQSATQDAVSFTRFTDGNDDAMVLAPLASRCLQRLSWRRSKTVHSQTVWDYLDRREQYENDGPFYDQDESEGYPEDGRWHPLRGA